ncbi:precorrin-6A synthase (deacetylating) [Ruegeria sp. 2205SS24-7]|uniref:precorrin-6A synthase (deacetylating) n=1 Tax=Ruegeria discodermiae TaxID=3064389 RepID=UPI002740E061|nr:precorrin-6A synthase (deacetylating) [Ruegeria sp. 2205SS24-7]MDP5216914.1 precorrin-6A synthase (deacetylating) [Ruegeria sp. 2205SS24-7]
MQELFLIGIGTGNPDHVTREGARAICEADLILIPRKGSGKEDLAGLREQIITDLSDTPPPLAHFDIPKRRANAGYLQGVEDWHDAIAQRWQEAIARHKDAKRVALLIWGDPSLYDSSLRIADRLEPKPAIRVIPGITAIQALTAAHAIPINELGAPYIVTTGRRIRDEGWPDPVTSVAVMLDGECSFQSLDPDRYDIWWGAFVGMQEQILIHGPLHEVSRQIIDTRATARTEHGWIMDIYLLRKRAG